MLAVERRTQIEHIITDAKSVMVIDLAKQFDVTPETIRGDLLKLEKQGILVRTYGGATLAGASGSELGFKERDTVNSDVKQKIGKRAAELIRNGETIFLDASTSALYLARNIKDKKGLTVITNAACVLTELADCDNIRLICTGGQYSQKNMSYSGRYAEKMIRQNFAANKFFFSCRGVTLSRGLVDSTEDEAELKKAMLERSESAIFLCDHYKLGKMGIPVIGELNCLDKFITDVRLDSEWSEALEEEDVSIITV
ncbi:MAG: DeoR/GlpR family DNA-binding transcription regulator [Clostridia bacterium]|nr:DeoR/GlpR family DNA-binding transcription regulator [Clostridia bacterium]